MQARTTENVVQVPNEFSSLQRINPQCAGIDIGAESIFIGIEELDVVSFGTFTEIEATGVYWITLFDMVDAAGIPVTLVNGKQVEYLPGRKSHVADCQWSQQLHTFGLQSLVPFVQRQIESVKELHRKDLSDGFGEVSVPYALEPNIQTHRKNSHRNIFSQLRIVRSCPDKRKFAGITVTNRSFNAQSKTQCADPNTQASNVAQLLPFLRYAPVGIGL